MNTTTMLLIQSPTSETLTPMINEEKQYTDSSAIVYFAGVIAMMMLGIQNFRYGLFELVYAAGAMVAVFIAMMIAIKQSNHKRIHYQLNTIALALATLIIICQAFWHPSMVMYWTLPIILASFLTLAHNRAKVMSVTLVLVLTALILMDEGWQSALMYWCGASLVIAVARAYSLQHQKSSLSLEELAIHDPNTGAYNQRYLEETLNKEQCRSDRTGRPISLVCLSIDYLNQITELHGINAKRDLVKQLSDSLGALIRAGDSRYSDDENRFYLLLPGTPSEGVVVISERIRRTIEESVWPTVDSITVSAGCTTFYPANDPRDAGEMIGSSQEALSTAIQKGKNRVYNQAS